MSCMSLCVMYIFNKTFLLHVHFVYEPLLNFPHELQQSVFSSWHDNGCTLPPIYVSVCVYLCFLQGMQTLWMKYKWQNTNSMMLSILWVVIQLVKGSLLYWTQTFISMVQKSHHLTLCWATSQFCDQLSYCSLVCAKVLYWYQSKWLLV
jgi:hypothetical protein